MDELETLKSAFNKNNIDEIIKIDAAYSKKMWNIIEDSKGTWKSHDIRPDEFATGLISERMKTIVFKTSPLGRENHMVVAGRYVNNVLFFLDVYSKSS